MFRLRCLCALIFSLGSHGVLHAEPSAAERFKELVDEAWEFDMREYPTWATRVGDHRFGDRLPRQTLADHERRHQTRKRFLARLENIDRAELSREDQINYDIFGRLLREDVAEHEFRNHLIPITSRSGFHISFPELRRNVPLDTVEDYENYIARLRAFGQYADDHIELMRAGVGEGFVLPDIVLTGYREPIEAHVVDDVKQSLLYEPFEKFPQQIAEADQERLRTAGAEAIRKGVISGYQRFLTFMKSEYVPAARGSIGISALEGGRAYYRFLVEKFTTLELTPEEVHNTGLAEVARIRKEMEAVIREVDESGEFEGDFAAFVQFLRTDPQFYAETPEELLKDVALVLKRMDGELPKLFGRLPRMSYGVREVPDYIAPRSTAAYYSGPAGDGTRAGFYYVNTYDLKSRPLYAVNALSLHEAVPGHHLQIALQQELDDLPKFRRYAGFTAFVEGWALYAERLGLEVGMYDDPYRNFGRLNYEMWRACRLVVDTGMHYQGWTRKQAIDYMVENSALSLHNITSEVDRYISWPGQALAYKMGELKIRELRRKAEQRLGPKFNIRDFHDIVLGSGSVPLPVLEDNVSAYLEKQLTE